MNSVDPRRIAFFLSTSGHSGVDRAARHLLPALTGRGYAVDLIKVRRHGPNIDPLPDGARIIDSGSSSTYGALPALLRYLRQARPAVLLADKDRVNRTAMLARWLAGAPRPRLVLSYGSTVSIDVAGRSVWERVTTRWSMGHLYPYADAVIVTSDGVGDDMSSYTGLARAHIRTVASPVFPAALLQQRPAPPDDPWFAAGAPPVILGVGELSKRKDFATLIRAFARLRQTRPARLLILGEGREREALQALVGELGLGEDVRLPGFSREVYRAMAHARAFVLSSRWEGLGFVLIEALACGTPVVSTDCPHGPREVLDHGHYGPLVAVGDDVAMAQALTQVLDAPLPPEVLRSRALPYEIEAATTAYLQAFALPERAP